MTLRLAQFQVRRLGTRTIVTVKETDVLVIRTTQWRDELEQLISEPGCNALVFDLAGVQAISSEVVGLLAWLLHCKVEVHVHNPSIYVLEVLEATQLTRCLCVSKDAECTT